MTSEQFRIFGYALAAAMLAVCFILSSAGAAHGLPSKPLPVYSTGNDGVLGNSDLVVGALVWEAPRKTFEQYHKPIEFLFQWPKLPSISEQQIKLAQDKLAVFLAEQAAEAGRKRVALELRYDWEAFQKALALALMTLGAFLSLIYVKKGKISKSYRE